VSGPKGQQGQQGAQGTQGATGQSGPSGATGSFLHFEILRFSGKSGALNFTNILNILHAFQVRLEGLVLSLKSGHLVFREIKIMTVENLNQEAMSYAHSFTIYLALVSHLSELHFPFKS